ncbi:MAG: sulfonate ABC transporter substrate-binding protein, partial [Hansschlegelia sp.]
IVSNHQFFLADRAYAEKNQDIVKTVLGELRSVEDWVQKDPQAAATELSPAVGIPAPLLATAISRAGFGVGPIKPEVVAQQQKIADAFLELKLIPKPITVADAVVQVTQ